MRLSRSQNWARISLTYCAGALRYYLKLKHRQWVQASAVCLQIWAHRWYIQADSVWMDHTSDQTCLLGGSGWGYSSPNPHQLPSKRAQSICLFLGVPPKLFPETCHGSGLLEEQQYVCFFLAPLCHLAEEQFKCRLVCRRRRRRQL